jgi:type II secretory pathway pseudopilin PulG
MVNMSPTNTSTSESKIRKPAIIAVAAIAIVALLAGGGWCGWKAYTGRELAEARQACVEASEGYRKAVNGYSKLVDGDAAAASKVAAGQVADAKTVGALSKELKVTEPKTVACVADDMAGYESKTGLIEKNTGWYGKHEKSLKEAVKAVNDSKLAKTVSDAERLLKDSDGKVQDASTRDELSKAVKAKNETAIAAASRKVNDSMTAKTKADEEAQRKAEEDAAAQAAAEAAAAAQQAQQSYAQQSYTPSYSAPQQSYTPSYSGGSTSGGGSGSSAPDFVPVSKGFGCTTDCGPLTDYIYH